MQVPAYDGYIFDLDGTLYLGDALLPGAQELLQRLRTSGRRVAFVSNNATRSCDAVVAKLARLGIPVARQEVVNSTMVTVRWLRQHAPEAVLYPIGEPPLIEELQAAGVRLSDDPAAITFVLASFDRTFAYVKLQVAFDAIRAGARLIATNADRYCPVPGGGQPDAAAVIAAIEACTGTTCDLVIGKPSPYMAQTAGAMLGLTPSACLVIGDRLETDIAMGKAAGMAAALVLTGASNCADLAAVAHQPDYVIDDLRALLPGLG
jgi:NagD protein